MKITDARFELYQWPKPRVVTSGRGRGTQKYQWSRLALIYIDTDEGITGVGAGVNAPDFDKLRDDLIGEDPLCAEKIWHKLLNKPRGNNYYQTISVIDIALWDLKAKMAGMPLYKLLGGVRDRVDCYVAGGYYAPDKTLLDLQHEMETYLSWNARAVKMKVGGLTPCQDAARVKAVREVIGPEVKLLMDANCAWNAFEAVEFAKRVEEYYPYWFEEPCAATDNDGFAFLASHTSIPLAAGESLRGKFEMRQLMDTGSVAFIQPDAVLCGGVSEVLKIAAYAGARHIQVAPHGLQQVHVHLNCAIQNTAITEFYSPTFDKLAYDAYRYPVRINSDGTVSPPENPGASFDINPDVLAPYRVK